MTSTNRVEPVDEPVDESVDAPRPKPPGGRGTRSALRWSSFAVVGRQVFQLACALLLARILGPASYGVISVAMIFVTLTALLLDQGLSAALIQRKTLTRRGPGAVATVNILAAIVMGGLAWLLAPMIGTFFGNALVSPLIQILGTGLILKGIAIVPRAMLSRELDFKAISLADVVGSAVGAVAGISAALAGAGTFSLLYQVFTADFVIAIILLVSSRGPVPNFHFRELGPLLAFSLRVFATNGIAYLSRNADNILVGRFLGVTSLSYYSMAYRVLVIPVQFLGQTVNRVMFPIFSRQAENRALVAQNLLRSTGLLSLAVVPVMTLLACASPQLVHIVLGDSWLPTAPLLSVLALAGARETIFYITPSLMKALGLASMNLRFEILSTLVQLAGIVVGLFFGVFGVALGYAIAGVVLTPVILYLQRRITGVSVGAQLGAILPYIHASIWAAAAYLGIGAFHLPPVLTLVVGAIGFAVVGSGVLLLVHRRTARRDLGELVSVIVPSRKVSAA